MIYSIVVSKSADSIIRKWKKSNPNLFTAHARIIYEIHDEIIKVLVLDVEGHYGDK